MGAGVKVIGPEPAIFKDEWKALGLIADCKLANVARLRIVIDDGRCMEMKEGEQGGN